VLGANLPTTAALKNIPFTGQVFSEALRLYPPAWLITRKAIEADQIDNTRIPPGALIILSPYTIHRHPQFWQNPEAFDPARFSHEQEKSRPRFAYIPFGGGPRLCIGDQFAMIEAQLIMAMVTQRFRLELLPHRPVEADPLVTIRPKTWTAHESCAFEHILLRRIAALTPEIVLTLAIIVIAVILICD
jgi:cytochrome P450